MEGHSFEAAVEVTEREREREREKEREKESKIGRQPLKLCALFSRGCCVGRCVGQDFSASIALSGKKNNTVALTLAATQGEKEGEFSSPPSHAWYYRGLAHMRLGM